MQTADLDGNGSLDLAFSNRTLDTIDFLYSDARPRGADCDENGIPDECQMPEQDCDGNGILDLCEIQRSGIVMNAPLSTHLGNRPQDVAHGDLDGDGSVDLAATHVTGVTPLLNDGSGHLAAGDTIPVRSPWAVATSDADGDGDLDLAVTSIDSTPESKNSVVLLLNQPSGFSPARDALVAKSPGDVLFSDLDRDGDLEIAVLTCSEVNGCSASAIAILHDTLTTVELPLRAVSFVAADLDGDAFPDLAVCGQLTYLQILLNQGGMTFGEPRLVAIGPEPRSLVAVDLDRDGDLDLAASDRTGSVQVTLNEGSGDFAPALTFALGPAPLTLAAADLDGDGIPDLVSGVLETCCDTPLSHLRPLRGTGTGAFVLLPQSPSFGGRPESLGSSDLDNDSDQDLYMIDADGTTVLVSLNTSPPPSSSIADCDGNGIPDDCELSRDPDLDMDRNSHLDACEGTLFRRADTNGDAVTDLSDAVDILGFLFLGTASPGCAASADTNGDGEVDIADPVVILSYLFLGDSPPARPFPDCGQGARRGLSCEAPGCP